MWQANPHFSFQRAKQIQKNVPVGVLAALNRCANALPLAFAGAT
jgi:hypothetical protein